MICRAFVLSLLIFFSLQAQSRNRKQKTTDGVVTYTPPSGSTAGHFTTTAGVISCTVTGNKNPANTVNVSCTNNGSAVKYAIPMGKARTYNLTIVMSNVITKPQATPPLGNTIPMEYGPRDQISFLIRSNESGSNMMWQATACSVTGKEVSLSGRL